MAPSQHPDATTLSEDELSAVASDTSEFISRRGQSARLLDAYEAESGEDKTKAILQAALDHLPVPGSMRIVEEIIQFNGDEDKYRQLVDFFVDAVLKPSSFTHVLRSIRGARANISCSLSQCDYAGRLRIYVRHQPPKQTRKSRVSWPSSKAHQGVDNRP